MNSDSSVAESTVEGQALSKTGTPSAERRTGNSLRVPGALSSASMKLVYFSLATNGPETPSELRDRLDLSLLSLYPLLEQLEREGLVEQTGEAYTARTSNNGEQ